MISITEQEYRSLSSYISANYGIVLGKEKKNLLVGRLYKTIERLGLSSFAEYYNEILNDKSGELVNELIDKITTNHTYFMRESSHFEYLYNIALPEVTAKIPDRDLRIWCAASSSGQEPYTLAMIVDEFLGNQKPLWDSKILATDISREILAKAQNGQYSNEELSSISKVWKNKYFTKNTNDTMTVKKSLKDEVIFRQFNLLTPQYPFKNKMHIIFCRNVLMYFSPETQEEIIRKLSSLLVPGGYLFIGKSESLSTKLKDFQYMSPSVYKKK